MNPADRQSVILIIRDGWGENPHPEHRPFNAIQLAETPVGDHLRAAWPTTLITTCGEDVGLPAGTMGNSEVGHQNIGAGRIVDQELMRITRAIRNESFFDNAGLKDAFDHATRGGKLHLLGLVSDGLVHSDIEHLLALIDLAARLEFPAERLFVHAITDGRDTSPTGGLAYIRRVEKHLAAVGKGRIASVMGRFYAMDRDQRWNRVARAYGCLTGKAVGHANLEAGQGAPRKAASASEAIQHAYDHPPDASRGGDEFIPPTQIVDPASGQPIGLIEDGDAVIFFNYRGDRPREITRAFVLDDNAWADVSEGGFERGAALQDLLFCTMCDYEHGLPVSRIAFARAEPMTGILGQVVQDAGLSQYRSAETEKFPHVTFFFNDYREEPFEGEQRRLVPSPRDVATYDLRPEMSAVGVCEGVLERLQSDDPEALFVVNFANADMVGHTGQLDAAIKAVETVDACVGRIVEATLARGGSLVITADHGNAEQMWHPERDGPHTAHTVYDVPLHVVGEAWRDVKLASGGRLADIAPTVLAMMGLPAPVEMTGQSLLGVPATTTRST